MLTLCRPYRPGGLWWRRTRQGLAGRKLIKTMGPGGGAENSLASGLEQEHIGLIDLPIPQKTHNEWPVCRDRSGRQPVTRHAEVPVAEMKSRPLTESITALGPPAHFSSTSTLGNAPANRTLVPRSLAVRRGHCWPISVTGAI
jgi:hypothetical protein